MTEAYTVDPEKVQERKAARELAEFAFGAIIDGLAELGEVPRAHQLEVYRETILDLVRVHMPVKLAESVVGAQPPKPAGSPQDEWRRALDFASEIIEDIDELPSAGAEFGESVGKTVRSIIDSIETTEAVSPKQRTALRNIRGGLNKWLDRRP